MIFSELIYRIKNLVSFAEHIKMDAGTTSTFKKLHISMNVMLVFNFLKFITASIQTVIPQDETRPAVVTVLKRMYCQ
jgi:hypothetical protein